MTTDITEVIDLFMMEVTDYRLNTLFQSSGSAAFNTYVESWLIMATNEFAPYCNQDLTYSDVTQTFAETLTLENKMMLAQIMVKYWLTKEVSNVSQFQLFLFDHDYSMHSAAQNLKEKREYLNAKKEEVSQLLIDYTYRHNDWATWNTTNFVV